MSKTRCAKTVPTSVAQRPFRGGVFRVSTATRASSPILPGRTAFARRPTQKAEKTSWKRGLGGGIAWLITICQAMLLATIERRLSATAAATHSHLTAWKASGMAFQSGPRHQSMKPVIAPIATITAIRNHVLRTKPNLTRPPARRSRRAGRAMSSHE